MIVVTDTETLDLGTTQTTPTIGITDYSVRTTDDFGVTTVTPRGFSRTLSAKMLVPTHQVDALQRSLADLRATSAQWIADDRFAWLRVQGFYKDFSVELALPTISYCTLTIEGLAETETAADAGGDPAPLGTSSTLNLLQPVTMTDAVLVDSSVPETDADDWNSTTSYAAGARVMRATTHRVYQSLSARNDGNTPETSPAVWLDLGPTNRWAMFDQALGTATMANGSIVVTFAAGSVASLALLDVTASTIRVQVQSTTYDETQAAGPGTVTFFDMPAGGGQVTVTVSGSGQVSVGTLLVGPVVALGITEASPTAGITDYSLKSVDDFGSVTIVQRAWSKQMTAKALIDIAAVDMVANRIASVRATPALWLGQIGTDSLTVYGFFKDFSIEVSETTAILSLTIEGLSKAAKVDPLTIGWSNVTDDNGQLPQPGATRNVPRGAWDALQTYAQGDVVTYQGSSYIAGSNVPFGTYPTNSTYWDLLASVGASGAPGVPGTNGSNGQPAYVHVAYADSADGSVNFVAGIANPGRAFIGIYTDNNATGSNDYHAYSWSRLTGQNGTNGSNGTAGPPGANGLTTYVHFGYADSADGSVNFTSGDPGARKYIGVYTDYTIADSNDYHAYAWSLIKGADGAPGIAGAPGANGQPAYVHVAYANSADGSQDFIAGQANPGRLFIGIYTDANSTGSGDYHAYNWSRLTGQNGTNGTNGTPGPVGANGAQSYVHFAYADSINGQVNFTTGDPGSRSFIGVYSDFTVPDSNSPAAYAWSLIKGADGAVGAPGTNGLNGADGASVFTFTDLQNCGIRTARTITKAVGGDAWNGLCQTDQFYTACTVSARLPAGAFVGLDDSPGGGNWSYTGLNVGWHRSDDTYDYWIYWNGSQQVFNQAGKSATASLYTVAWDGKTAVFIRDGQVIAKVQQTWAAMTGEFCIYHQGSTIYDIAYAPGGLYGNDGAAGAIGPVGQPGSAGGPGPAGPPGPSGTSPSPSYPAINIGGEGTYTYPNPIPLAAGQTVTGAAFVRGSMQSGSATVAMQIQYSLDGAGSWTSLASDSEYVGAGEPAGISADGQYTNGSGARQVVNLRTVISRNGSAVNYSGGFMQPS